MTITIEITSDFICPWCLVAHTRLNKAIAQLNRNVNIERIWYPFELNPDMPEMGMERKIYRTQKFGSWEHSQQLDAKTIKACQDDGIKFRYDLMEVTPNTHKAHRLNWFAAEQGKATEMAEAILTAYFGDAAFIPRPHTAAGVSKAAANAIALTDALVIQNHDVKKALDDWEIDQLRLGMHLWKAGQDLGEGSQFLYGKERFNDVSTSNAA